MIFLLKAVRGALASLLLVASSAWAAAIVPTLQSFEFVGNCSDCAAAAEQEDPYLVRGVLTLQNYTLGDELTAFNFYSFSYEGSNLLDPFTVGLNGSSADYVFDVEFQDMHGVLSTIPGANHVGFDWGEDGEPEIFAGQFHSITEEGSAWFIAIGQFSDDEGLSHVWNPTTNRVPEPGALAMLGLGLLVVSRRRRT